MLATQHVLEILNVTHSGQVDETTCLQSLFGYAPTGLILKDVSIDVRGGEMMAILGSTGSGKETLLEVISRRAIGSTKGQVLLNGVPMTVDVFKQCCAYVPRRVDLLPGLTVYQTLHFSSLLTIGSKVSDAVKRTRVKQVLADLALHHVAQRDVAYLSASEYKRLCIGIQLIRDPVVLLLDEPTLDLDPLNTYFIVSILANHAKKYARAVMLTIQKPRSDVFPFLDKVTYLCMGDVVYSGNTRIMLDYFRNIGFPCPELENPLMYYLCLSTVDRRSRERIIDSTGQIGSLVEKFRLEGAPYRKSAPSLFELGVVEPYNKVSLTVYGMPSFFSVFWTLLSRRWCVPVNGLVNLRLSGLHHLFLSFILLPLCFTLLFIFYFRLTDFQRSYQTRNGLLFSCLSIVSFVSAGVTAVNFAPHRTVFYQETRDGLYKGPLFIASHVLYSIPISLVNVFVSSGILYWATGLRMEGWRFATFSCILWSCYFFVELQTICLQLLIRSSYTAASISGFISSIYLITSSGMIRSLLILPDWLYYLSFAMIYRYAGAFLNEIEFWNNLVALSTHFNSTDSSCSITNSATGCVYLNGTHYLSLKYHLNRNEGHFSDLGLTRNFIICFVFCGAMLLVTILAYLLPLPGVIKSKFRK
uniref:ABC transporter domain-containing protein n=1 Tax=Strigamia maritima TaxID=126957 RepID=T1J9E6_STRMM